MTEGDTKAARDDSAVLGDLAPHEVRVGFLRLRPATCTSATSAAPCSTGCSPGTTAGPSYSGWRTPTRDEPRGVIPGPLRLPHLAGSDVGRGSTGRRYGPYIQTERGDIYRDVVDKLLAAKLAYRCYCTREEIEAREAARPWGRLLVTTASAATSSEQRIAELEAMSTPSVVRMRVPDADIAFDDLVRGPVRFAAAHVPDYVIVRANGEPLYTLVNPVDDSLMEITHVLRGEDLLPSTPRQIVLYDALKQIGVGSGRTPAFGHLPTVLGEGNRRLSKRDKGSGLAEYQQKGYLPEGLLNYLALLGWGIAEDRDVFTIAEMVEAFDIRRVNASPLVSMPRSARRSTLRTFGCFPRLS